jgi:predicted PurR-regulated permease PerM
MFRNPWVLVATLAGIVLCALFFVTIRSIAVPFLLALILAYFLDPAADYLESRKFSRPLAVCTVFAIFLVAAAAVFAFLIPAVRSEVALMQKALPAYAERLYSAVPAPLAEFLGIAGGEDLKGLVDRAIDAGRNLSSDVLKQIAVFLSRAFSSTFGFLLAVLGYFIIPVYLFYLLRDFDRMKAGVADLIPPRHRRQILDLGGEIDGVLSGFIRGQLSVCLVLAVLYSLGLAVIGIDLALVIGIISGMAFIIPYLGTILGIIAATIMAALKFHDLLHPLMAVGWFLLVQGLEGAVITPFLVGDRVGLHPLATILAVLIGGELFGFLGLLLAVPVAASANVLWRRLLANYRGSAFFAAPAGKGKI